MMPGKTRGWKSGTTMPPMEKTIQNKQDLQITRKDWQSLLKSNKVNKVRLMGKLGGLCED